MRDRFTEDFLDQLSTTLADLGQPRPGIAVVPLVHLSRHIPQAASITVDFTRRERFDTPLVIVAIRSEEPDAPDWNSLTRRERDVARLLATGMSNKIIADRLGITLGTVKCYVHRILAKTGTTSRASFASRVRPGSVR